MPIIDVLMKPIWLFPKKLRDHALGMVLVNQERLDEALQHYEEALKIRKNYTKAHYNLGVALAKQGRLAEARHHFAEVLRLEPNHVAARRFLESSQ